MLSVSNISVQFGSKKLFDDVSFIVNPRDRIGLVGSNGTGKSTLLKVINHLLEPDSGIIAGSKHTTIDYLPQDGIAYSGKTLYEEVYSGVSDVASVKDEIDDVHKELAEREDKDSEEYHDLVETLGELQHKFEDLDGFKIKSSIEKILMGLGFKVEDMDRLTEEFSGGWQMRIALAKLLLKNPSVLLLDEPTNHLDIESLLWLENFLKAYEGSVVLVSHDRKFLDNITNKTIEIYTGKVTLYNGNYSFYEKEKEERRGLIEKRYLNQQKYLTQQERFIERFRYKAKKASQVQSRIKMLEKLELVEMEDEESAIHFKFPPATHSGRKVIELKNITKWYDDNLVLKNVDLEIERGEKIGFVGVNGAGKSTLARIIRGTEDFREGERILGYQVELEFYSQHQADTLEPNHTVLDTLEEVATGDVRKLLRNILGSFLFKGDDVFKQVSVLSGGEKSRLALARMLLKSSNFLILDEPTNHLDMNSKKVLMNALNEYQGTILIISHDREFLDGIVHKIIEVKDRNIKTYFGNCTAYLERKAEEQETLNGQQAIKKADDEPESKAKKTKEQKRNEAEIRNKIYNETKPLKQKISKIEHEIKLKEERLKAIELEMSSEEFYRNPENVKTVNKEFGEIKQRLTELYHDWMNYTNSLMEIEEKHKG
ncbi:MAG: ABC transporter ATP-binding protein [Ignavibacteriae bacterium]|nr:MAG: ABC transporter ATP-binding protein [Ignavibacteriota bacterium]